MGLDPTAKLASEDARVHTLVVPATDAISDHDQVISADPTVLTPDVSLLVVWDVAEPSVEPVAQGLLLGLSILLLGSLLLEPKVSHTTEGGNGCRCFL